MPEVSLRKRLTAVEEIFHEGGPLAASPLRRAVALAVMSCLLLAGAHAFGEIPLRR